MAVCSDSQSRRQKEPKRVSETEGEQPLQRGTRIQCTNIIHRAGLHVLLLSYLFLLLSLFASVYTKTPSSYFVHVINNI